MKGKIMDYANISDYDKKMWDLLFVNCTQTLHQIRTKLGVSSNIFEIEIYCLFLFNYDMLCEPTNTYVHDRVYHKLSEFKNDAELWKEISIDNIIDERLNSYYRQISKSANSQSLDSLQKAAENVIKYFENCIAGFVFWGYVCNDTDLSALEMIGGIENAKTSLEFRTENYWNIQRQIVIFFIKKFVQEINDYEISEEDDNQIPILDLNAMAFATQEEYIKYQENYAKKLAHYTNKKLGTHLNTSSSCEIPILDISGMAFDDNETIFKKQKVYATQLVNYIKSSISIPKNPPQETGVNVKLYNELKENYNNLLQRYNQKNNECIQKVQDEKAHSKKHIKNSIIIMFIIAIVGCIIASSISYRKGYNECLLYTNDAMPIVFITRNGERYHSKSCEYVRNNDAAAISLLQAEKAGYTCCSVCKPTR